MASKDEGSRRMREIRREEASFLVATTRPARHPGEGRDPAAITPVQAAWPLDSGLRRNDEPKRDGDARRTIPDSSVLSQA
jgi:hypothetical protein